MGNKILTDEEITAGFSACGFGPGHQCEVVVSHRALRAALARAEEERDWARRRYCENEAGQEGSPETAIGVASEMWGRKEADRLFPKRG